MGGLGALALVVVAAIAVSGPAGSSPRRGLVAAQGAAPGPAVWFATDAGPPVPVASPALTFVRIDAPGGSVTVTLDPPAGQAVDLAVLVPDAGPEADRPSQDALSVRVVGAGGDAMAVPVAEPIGAAVEPVTGGGFLRLAEVPLPVDEGPLELRVSAAVPTRSVLVTGAPGTELTLEGADPAAVAATEQWLATPPAADRAAALDDAEVATSGEAAGPLDPARGPSPDTGAGATRDVIGRSAGWGLLVAVLALMGVVSLLALRPWRRRAGRPRPGQG